MNRATDGAAARFRPTTTRLAAWLLSLTPTLLGCPKPVLNEQDLIERGREIFFNETFDGNGRTCGTCHRALDNLGLSPAFVATLPADDPLFVAETRPDLAQGFEKPALMRSHALILENQDGFDDLEGNFNMRGIPHTLALRTSVDSRDGPQTGWSGDGSPGDGSLRSFAVGAVIQHFPLTTRRVAGTDFRLPTDDELDAIEAFLLAQGRQEDLTLPLPLLDEVAVRGQEIFLDDGLAKCNLCHFNAGANADPEVFGVDAGNLNFDTGVEDLPDQPGDLLDPDNPPDDGRGRPGTGEFNTPPLVEAADTGPFFHNNSVPTIEGAVAFYNGDAFAASPAGQTLVNATGSGINLDATQIAAVAAFLRVINALENIRAASALLEDGSRRSRGDAAVPSVAVAEIEDAIEVLEGASLHGPAVVHLKEARRLVDAAAARSSKRLEAEARGRLDAARSHLIRVEGGSR